VTSESSGRDERALALQRTRTEAARCTACPLWEIGTQTVFGDGPPDAKLMFIGEAPGQQEDKSGVPFVGPAGKLFNEILDAVHIDRSTVYVTNAVKHRPWVDSGGRKKNRAPKQSEINACAPWLDLEIELIQPQIVCCLGAVAAKRILGRDFKLTQQRGQWFESELVPHVFATIHPSFILIQPRDTSERWLEVLTSDLRTVKERLLSLSA
jgi:uracil-DNA glycosylase